MRRMICLAAAAAAAVGGWAATGAAATAPRAHASATTLRTSAKANGAWKFTTTRLVASHAGRITIRMRNPGSSGTTHGIAVAGHGKGRKVSPGHTATITLRLHKGRYTFFCPVPGHRAAGMKGTLIVR